MFGSSLVTEKDGEVLFDIKPGESLNIRSVAQTKSDKLYSPMIQFKKGRFIKVMIEEKEVVDKLKKSPATYMALNIMKRYITPNYNVLLKPDGKKYKCVDLAKDMDISRQMAARHLKELQKLNLIQEVETANKGTLWAINPNYYFMGNEIPQKVVNAFIIDFKN